VRVWTKSTIMSTGSNIARPNSSAIRTLLPVVAALLFCAVVALVFFAFDPTRVSFFPPCLFHLLTGWDCPGCGAQRALHELLHGDIIAALRLNAMFVLSLPLAAWFGPQWAWRVWQRRPLMANPKWLCYYAAAWLVFGVLRNLPFPVCAWFFAP